MSATLDALFRLHQHLPRQGPGGDEFTQAMLKRLPDLPTNPTVLDLGCGSGSTTLVLARELAAPANPIAAVDIYAPYLQDLSDRAAGEGLGDRVRTYCADFAALDWPTASVDLIWSEGAIFILGFAEGLRCWRSLLKPGGLMVVSDCTWLDDEPPDELRQFWQVAYPTMATVAENAATATEVGFEVLSTAVLPPHGWWDEFYVPLRARMTELKPHADPDLLEAIAESEHEIDLFRRYGDSYGYAFYLLRRATEKTIG
ncbi:methyltransferase domain protein [Rubidibacter lacunae KORDI 51-2]|uniref:Methyltransferase domain protein n=2 Tax=Rubidibacter TaxID=582491 RepID=U5DFC3_9CHRO|nr:methyltransferase domain protein [Rubidibacter lacunae KORDI 51-2]